MTAATLHLTEEHPSEDFMDKRHLVALLITIPLCCAGCTHKEQSSTSSTTSESTNAESTAAASAEAATSAPMPAQSGPLFATFNFNDVAVTSSAAPLLRLGFDLKNNGKDPLLCDPTEFSVQLSDGSVIPADTGAEDTCDPDTVDPGSTGKVVMFFDLKNAYTGPVTLLMTANDTLVGKDTAQVH